MKAKINEAQVISNIHSLAFGSKLDALKDKYVTSAMANLFVQEELEVKLTEKRNTRWDCKRAMKFKAPRTHY